MAIAGGQNSHSRWAALRDVFAGPQLAAFLPAVMLGAYWFGGEGVLLTTAVIFPALMAFAGLVTRPTARPARRDGTTGLPDRQALVQHVDMAFTPGATTAAWVSSVKPTRPGSFGSGIDRLPVGG